MIPTDIKISIIEESFTSNEEIKLATSLSNANEKWIRNLIAQVGREYMALEVNSDPVKFAESAGFLRGQIAILNYLLELSATANTTT